MEFLVVSDSKLKIMMNSEEMKSFQIDGDDIDYENPKVRRAFWRILDKARERCGFDVSGDKILIQYYPSKDGAEIFVTKLGLLPNGDVRTLARSNKVAMLTTGTSVYKFTSLSSLLGAIRLIDTEVCEGVPRVFFDGDDSYYVVSNERRSYSEKCNLTFLFEYGNEVPSVLFGYIAEHSRELDFTELLKLSM